VRRVGIEMTSQPIGLNRYFVGRASRRSLENRMLDEMTNAI